VVARGLGSFMDYYYLLKYSDDAAEWERVMDALSVQETYFWREIDQIRAVVTELVPKLTEELRGRPLRIWSAPCATGEEPLTLAMMLQEDGWFARAPIEIVGSDASRAAIAKPPCDDTAPGVSQPGAGASKNTSTRPGISGSSCPSSSAACPTTWSISWPRRGGATRRCADYLLPERVHLFFRSQHPPDAGDLRAIDAGSGYLCVGACESLLRLGTSFDLEIGGAFCM
jgi:chemotaxis protein methyltransferase CheR